MQALHKNKNEKFFSREENSVGIYMQESADIYKENMIEDLENGSLKLPTVGEFLANLKQKLRNGNNELVKITKLKKLEQGSKTIEEFV